MHDRSEQLVSQVTRQVRDFVRLVTDLTPEQLARPCRGEKEGDTIAVLTMRVTAVYDRMTAIVDAVAIGDSAKRGARRPKELRLPRPGPGRGQTQAQPKVLAARLEERGLALAASLRRLGPAQLSRPLPMTVEGFDHMDKPVGMIVEFLLYCQADRLETMRRAAADSNGEPHAWILGTPAGGPAPNCHEPGEGAQAVGAVAEERRGEGR